MFRFLISCCDRKCLPSFKSPRKIAQFIFINCFVLIVSGILFFSVQHFKGNQYRKHFSYDITKNRTRTDIPSHTKTVKKDPTGLYNIPPVPNHSSSDFVAPVQRSIIEHYLKYKEREYKDTVVILTPIHNVARLLPQFGRLLKSLSYPHELISLAFGEDCSTDATLTVAREVADDLRTTFKKVDVLHFDITGAVNGKWNDIHKKQKQRERRGHMAKARNMLMKAALKNATWALWIDSDISHIPPDIIQQLMSSGKDIVVPACLYNSNGLLRVFDKNTWRETPESLAYQENLMSDELILEGYGVSRRIFLTDLRAEGRVVPIDGVGGCTLLIKADSHRKGLIFPETILDHHIETEGLGKMAKKMGMGVYGMPFVEVLH